MKHHLDPLASSMIPPINPMEPASQPPLPWQVPQGEIMMHGGMPSKMCNHSAYTVKESTLPYPFAEIFPHVAYMGWEMIAMGIIWSLALGFAAGNYACSLVHRLPRGLGILEKKPYCGSCNTMLATKDLFPVISAILLKHKCRYCSADIPKTHFYTELLIGVLFCLCYFVWGFSEPYLLVAILGCMLTVLASIHVNENKVDGRILVAVVGVGMLLRVLEDGTIYSFFYGGLYALILGCIIWWKQLEKRGHIYVPSTHALLLAIGGVCVGEQALVVFLPIYAVLALTFSNFKTKVPVTVAFGLAVILTLILAPVLKF